MSCTGEQRQALGGCKARVTEGGKEHENLTPKALLPLRVSRTLRRLALSSLRLKSTKYYPSSFGARGYKLRVFIMYFRGLLKGVGYALLMLFILFLTNSHTLWQGIHIITQGMHLIIIVLKNKLFADSLLNKIKIYSTARSQIENWTFARTFVQGTINISFTLNCEKGWCSLHQCNWYHRGISAHLLPIDRSSVYFWLWKNRTLFPRLAYRRIFWTHEDFVSCFSPGTILNPLFSVFVFKRQIYILKLIQTYLSFRKGLGKTVYPFTDRLHPSQISSI